MDRIVQHTANSGLFSGRPVVAARGRPGGTALGRVVGRRVDRVEAQGKHLLIGFDNGLTLHTHLRMAVCFDAPTVELLDTRALALHPALKALGPDLLRRLYWCPECQQAGATAQSTS